MAHNTSAVIDRLLSDDEVHAHLRRAASEGMLAVRRMTGRDRRPPKRRGRVLIIALAAGAAAAVATNRRTTSTHSGA
jgi:hypothetical protein